MMKRNRMLAVVVLTMPLLGSCAQVMDRIGPTKASAETAAERDLLASKNKIVDRSTLQGLAAGAVAGCAAGSALSSKDWLKGCFIGSVLGAAAGGAAGQAVGKGNAAAAKAEFEEDQLIETLAKQERGLMTLESNLHVVLAEQRQRMAILDGQLAAKKIDEATHQGRAEQMRSVREEVAETLRNAKSDHESLNVQLASWKDGGRAVDAVQVKNSANLERIEKLLDVADSFDPEAI